MAAAVFKEQAGRSGLLYSFEGEIVMSESEQAVDITGKFQSLTTDERRRSILSTSLTLMGLMALQERLERVCVDKAAAIRRPEDESEAAATIISRFVLTHTDNLVYSLTKTLAAMASHSPGDSDFVSRIMIAVFDLEDEMPKGEEHAEDEGSAESATSPVGQNDGEAANTDNGQ